MDLLWISYGFPMDPQWIPYGSPYEFPMDSLWIPMDSPWIPHEFPMDLLDQVNIDPYINPCMDNRIPI